MNSFWIVVHIRVPIVGDREQLFQRFSGAAFSRSQNPVGADNNSTTSNSFKMNEPFMRAKFGCLPVDNSDLLAIRDREIISEK